MRTPLSVLALILASISTSAVANPVVKSALEEFVARPTDKSSLAILQKRLDPNVGASPSVFSEWSNKESAGDDLQAWAMAGTNLIEMADHYIVFQPQFARSAINGAVVPQDGLFNLDRPVAASYSLPKAIMNNGYVVVAGLPASSDVHTSSARMLKGLPPAGPDGKPILVCKMGKGPSSYYYELSSTQRVRLRETTGLPFSQCLPPYAQSAYWKARLVDFVGPDGAYTDRVEAGRVHD